MSEEGGTDIAEIAGRYAHDEILSLAQSFHAGIGIEIVECLRQETGHVNRISRSELHVVVELLVHEGILHECLTIVEDTIHLDGRDVLAKCRKLALLNGRYLTLRIEHIHVDALNTEETIGHCRARIARGGHQDIDQTVLSVLITLSEIPQQACHEAGTHILKGEGRAMEEFQTVDIILDLDHRTIEGESVVNNVLKGIEVDVLTKESTGHIIGNLLERHILDVVEEHLRQYLDFFRHVKTAVFCQTFHNGLLEVSDRGFSVSAVIIHRP